MATEHPPLYPLFADLRSRRVLVVGGGAVARRKVEALLAAGADVVVGAPKLEARLAEWVNAGRVDYLQGGFAPTWLDGAWLAIAATDDATTNRAVAAAAETRRIWANVVDDLTLTRFHVPARIERGPLQIAVSSGGSAPMLSRHVRELLERQFDASLGALARLFGRERARIRTALPDLSARRRFFVRVLDGAVARLLRAGREADAQAEFDAALAGAAPATRGSVALVGAGPGDPGLLTLHALHVLGEADVILHDRLVGAEVLALARRDADRIEVGKRVGDDHHATQARIHTLMIAHAHAGRRVVRLKGGDPFVFGRGGEELQALRAHGIDYEVVPGITAAVACAAYAGIPLTHRDHAQSARLVTAHCKASLDTLDWTALARERQTLAVYMGVGLLDILQARLLAHGMPADTPFALVENGSRPGQRVIAGTLDVLAATARDHGVQPPALLIVGAVAGLARKLHWFGATPLGPVVEPMERAA